MRLPHCSPFSATSISAEMESSLGKPNGNRSADIGARSLISKVAPKRVWALLGARCENRRLAGPNRFTCGHRRGPMPHATAMGSGKARREGILLFRPFLSGVQNGENDEMVAVYQVRNDIRCASNNEFACPGFASGAAKMRVLGKPFHGNKNVMRYAARRCRLILLDKLTNLDEVGDGRFRPDYSHDGGGNSRFLPQERNQCATFS